MKRTVIKIKHVDSACSPRGDPPSQTSAPQPLPLPSRVHGVIAAGLTSVYVSTIHIHIYTNTIYTYVSIIR